MGHAGGLPQLVAIHVDGRSSLRMEPSSGGPWSGGPWSVTHCTPTPPYPRTCTCFSGCCRRPALLQLPAAAAGPCIARTHNQRVSDGWAAAAQRQAAAAAAVPEAAGRPRAAMHARYRASATGGGSPTRLQQPASGAILGAAASSARRPPSELPQDPSSTMPRPLVEATALQAILPCCRRSCARLPLSTPSLNAAVFLQRIAT